MITLRYIFFIFSLQFSQLYANPWGSGPITSMVVPKGGMEVEMAMSPGQTRPGGWVTTDHIKNVDFVWNELAFTPEFNPELSHVQKFHIHEGTLYK